MGTVRIINSSIHDCNVIICDRHNGKVYGLASFSFLQKKNYIRTITNDLTVTSPYKEDSYITIEKQNTPVQKIKSSIYPKNGFIIIKNHSSHIIKVSVIDNNDNRKFVDYLYPVESRENYINRVDNLEYTFKLNEKSLILTKIKEN